jgi:acetyl-CoA synthetase
VRRGGRSIPLKPAVDEALQKCPDVTKVLVWRREGDECPMVEGRDECLLGAMEKQSVQCEPEKMDSEDGMFLLYTSGSTGKPKGILHTTGGYLLNAMLSFKYTFDYREGGIFITTIVIENE